MSRSLSSFHAPCRRQRGNRHGGTAARKIRLYQRRGRAAFQGRLCRLQMCRCARQAGAHHAAAPPSSRDKVSLSECFNLRKPASLVVVSLLPLTSLGKVLYAVRNCRKDGVAVSCSGAESRTTRALCSLVYAFFHHLVKIVQRTFRQR